MIVYYYTNAQTKDGEQKDPKKSLGGFVSSTPVPNSRIGNLFGNLSAIALQNGEERIIAVAAKNIGTTDLSNVTFAVNAPSTEGVEYRFALVTVEDGVMEQIDHFDALPYVANFLTLGEDIQNNDPQPVISTLPAGGSIGIWIQRVITASDSPDCDVSTDIDLNIDIMFAWD